MDAQSGKIALKERFFDNFPAIGTLETRYSGTRTAVTDHINNTFHLEDQTTGRAIIRTWNANNASMLSISNLAPFRNALTDNDNNWTQAEHRPNNNDMGLDVHWALQQIRNRLFDVHTINSYDDNGAIIEAFIRHDTGKDADNAAWLIAPLNVMVFGAGHTLFNPLASVDVVAHEFGHGITRSQIDTWTGVNTQLFREGISDIWGAIMKHRITPNQPAWLSGNQIMQSSSYSCSRNLQNTNDPNAYLPIANTCNTTQYNNGNAYVRSGVFSHWFYLLVNGGSGTNGIGNSYAVHGVGMDAAENIIVEAVFNDFLRNTTSFNDIRTSMINAVRSLHRYDSVEEMSVTNAWHAVGVGNQFVCPATVNFVNQVVSSNRTVVSCSNLKVQNAKVQNGAKLILDAAGEVNIISDFEVDLGSEFEIK